MLLEYSRYKKTRPARTSRIKAIIPIIPKRITIFSAVFPLLFAAKLKLNAFNEDVAKMPLVLVNLVLELSKDGEENWLFEVEVLEYMVVFVFNCVRSISIFQNGFLVKGNE